MNQQLVSYIQQQLRSGYDLNSIKSFLIQQGYNVKDVEESVSFVNQQRLSSLVDYIRSSLGRGIDPDTLRAQLSSSGYPMPDINEALSKATKRGSKFPSSAVLIILVALVIFGPGLFYFWPSSKAGGTTGPDITETGTGAEDQGIAFEKNPTVSAETPPPQEEIGQEAVRDTGTAEEEDFQIPPAAEQPSAEQVDFASETSDFESLMDRASKETDAERAMDICSKAENSMYKDACYDQLSKSFDNSAICAKIEDEEIRDQCYLRVVLKNKDYSLCENIVDSNLYNSCLSMQKTPPAENMTLDDLGEMGV
ncbi:hypothetical protein COV19_07180 [Candidatus Woesearchaeota archaeon CG10_big_fil_rev_8_21_14_0_10_44_13]|nr:MAG: hypothetical protein COV19_07180 [Candidatus Woesearchaeota archaeon CG10_big_fil_rev_8_21_14_0_10_44_13]